ncbi:MAG: hypothetical protein KIT10_03895 [Flavobacteriales bacterium]|nr:hypothetical protein [Flavobacteriales bacterium]
MRLSSALSLIAREGSFRLSYNAAAVPGDSSVTIHADDERVDLVLKRLLPAGLRWKESGGHLIITGAAGRKRKFTASGHVTDARTNAPIAGATVFETGRTSVATTDDRGAFHIPLTGDLERTPLLVARHGYRDTIVHVPREGPVLRIALRPLEDLERIATICAFERCAVEDLGMTRLLVPVARMDQAANLDLTERRTFQLSLIPSVSTNGPLAGTMVNRFSVNIIGGYAAGVEGVEVGGGFNMLRDDMKGLQVGGLANLVGGHTRGVQIGGAINHSMRSLEGLQLAGLANTVWDTLTGWQVAGGVNVVKRGMSGTQVSGTGNVSLGDLDGVQITGGVNVAQGAVDKAQVAGAVNYAHSVRGGQVAGGVNVVLGDVGGGQVGFGANYARSVSGGQFSFGANVVPDSVSGGQVGFGLNYAGHVTGGQFSFGANVVPGTASGGQVGALNFARRALGGQVGFINLSDTLAGGAVGLLTISLKGYHRFDLVTGDVMPLSLHIRTGTRPFHNILGYSPPVSADERWGFLYGIGFEPRFGEHFFANIDITAEQVVEQRAWVDAWNVLGRIGLTPGWRFSDRFFLFAGPVFNLLATDWRDAETGDYLSALPPAAPPYQQRSGTTMVHGWWGWKAGAGVRF